MDIRDAQEQFVVKYPIVVIGMMGSGKTALAQALGAALAIPVWDNDAVLERESGLDAVTWEAKFGIDALHQYEERILESACLNAIPAVGAAPASCVLSVKMRRILQSVTTLWLKVNPTTLAARLTSDPHRRPNLGENMLGTLQAMEQERLAWYITSSSIVLDGNGHTTAELCAQALGAMGLSQKA